MSEKIKLEAWEVICDNCNGSKPTRRDGIINVCTKCWGAGKLDWVEVCTGKQMPNYVFNLPRLRKTYPKLIAGEILSVQPMDKLYGTS